MFKRWMILLAALFGLACIGFNGSLPELEDYSQTDECWDYLKSMPENWNSAADNYYWKNCDSDNAASAINLQEIRNESRARLLSFYIYSGFTIICLMLASIVGRWVVKGRPW